MTSPTHIITIEGCPPCDYVKRVRDLGAFPGIVFVEAADLPRVLPSRSDLRAVLDALRTGSGGLSMPAWLQMADGRLVDVGPVSVGIEFPSAVGRGGGPRG